MVACIDAHRDRFGVEPICRVLRHEGYRIAPSTYYAAKSLLLSARAVRDAWLEGEIVRVFKASGERSGARKVWWDLHREHIAVGRCTVERLMRLSACAGSSAAATRWSPRCRTPRRTGRATWLLDFRACAPNGLWVVDFTYVATWAGTVYTALVIDAFSRMIVGWRTAGHHRMTLVLDALVMAVAARRREGVTVAGAVHHSDAGSEYLAIRYGRELTAAGMTPLVGSVGDSYDNALAESMIGLYKTEVIAHQGPWRDWLRWRRPPPPGSAGSTSSGCSGRSAGGRRRYQQAYYAGELDPAAPAAGSKTPGKSTRKTKKTTYRGGTAATDLFRPAPPTAGRCPTPWPSSEMGATRTVKGGGAGASPRRVLIDATEPPASQGRLRRRGRGRKRPPCPVRGTGGTARGCPTRRCQPPGNRRGGGHRRMNTHHHDEQMFDKTRQENLSTRLSKGATSYRR